MTTAPLPHAGTITPGHRLSHCLQILESWQLLTRQAQRAVGLATPVLEMLYEGSGVSFLIFCLRRYALSRFRSESL